MDENKQQIDIEAMLNRNQYRGSNQAPKPFAKRIPVLIIFPLIAVVIGLIAGGMSGWAISSAEAPVDSVYEYDNKDDGFDVAAAKQQMASLHQDLWATDIPEIKLNEPFHAYDARAGYTDFEITLQSVTIVDNPNTYMNNQVVRVEMTVKNLEKDQIFFWTSTHLQVLDQDGMPLEDVYTVKDQNSADIASGATEQLVAYYEYDNQQSVMIEVWGYDMAYAAGSFTLVQGGER